MSWIMAIFARWGVPERVRRPLAGILAVIVAAVLLWLLWGWWLRGHDRAVVAGDRAATRIEVGDRQLGTERDAGAAKDARDADFRNEQQEMKEAAHAPIVDDNRTGLDALGERMRGRAAAR